MIAVATQAEPYLYVQIQGQATIEPDESGVRAALLDITARYLGADRAESYVNEDHSAAGEALVRVNSSRIHASL